MNQCFNKITQRHCIPNIIALAMEFEKRNLLIGWRLWFQVRHVAWTIPYYPKIQPFWTILQEQSPWSHLHGETVPQMGRREGSSDGTDFATSASLTRRWIQLLWALREEVPCSSARIGRDGEECSPQRINPELILCYLTIQNNVDLLIEELKRLEKKFPKRDAYRKKFFYTIRDKWNENLCTSVDDFSPKNAAKRVAKTIFLNKTCFNGLFRVNSKGGFNVPYGYYKNPSFVNEDNLMAVSKALQCAVITCQPYDALSLEAKENFVYFDPPYRPLTTSSSFTAYSKIRI